MRGDGLLCACVAQKIKVKKGIEGKGRKPTKMHRFGSRLSKSCYFSAWVADYSYSIWRIFFSVG